MLTKATCKDKQSFIEDTWSCCYISYNQCFSYVYPANFVIELVYKCVELSVYVK